ncbi:MAG: hypothetical protein ACYTDT_04115, partial [Planctomycetota bacterium]
MDRGVKIAIFVASIGSLALGLIWDQVLTNAREAVKVDVADEMGPEVQEGRIGSPDLDRVNIINNTDTDTPVDITPVAPAVGPATEPVPQEDKWIEYTVQN